MNGIYLHIPFCKSKCHYCDFYSVVRATGRDRFESLLMDEVNYRAGYLSGKQIDTIYFGGGTPTLLHPRQLALLLDFLKSSFAVDPGAEITLEANPDDLSTDRIRQYREAGFNRISIGIQSFHDDHLRFMNRRHDSRQAAESVHMALEGGISNISIDLIYGIPGMTADQWKRNVATAAGLPVTHISAYHLTIESGTRFGKLRRQGLFSEIPDEESVTQYRILREILDSAGYDQYEISNFARSGLESRHNSKYWTGEEYLGLGPSAHSFNGSGRHWNPRSLAAYTRQVERRELPPGEEVNERMRRNEYVMTRLRTSRGISESDFNIRFGPRAWPVLMEAALPHLRRGYLLVDRGVMRFDRDAWFQSDGILSDLFLEQ